MTWSEFLLGVFGALILDEFLQWSTKLSNWFIRRSVSILPPELRERMHEEWLAHADTIPGRFCRLLFAIDTLRGSCILGHNARLPEISLWKMAVKRGCDIVIAGITIVTLLPVFLVIALAMWIGDGSARHIIRHEFYLGRDGEIFASCVFNEFTLLELEKKGEIWAIFGRFVWQWRLFQLPVWFSILSGKMSLIGPLRWQINRIEHRNLNDGVAKIKDILGEDLFRKRCAVRPGRVACFSEEGTLKGSPFAEEGRYVENYSLLRDAKIFLKWVTKKPEKIDF